MKRPILTRVLLPMALLSVAAAVPSQAQILTNGSFETQNPPLATNGKVNGFATLTGWASTGGTPTDSGVQGSGYAAGSAVQQPENGSFFVYEKGSDPGLYQITGTQLVTGDALTLTWYSLNSYQAPMQDVSLLASTATTSTFAAATMLTSSTASLGTVPTAAPYYTMYTLNYTVPAAYNGDYVGVSILNTAAAGNYLQTDNYTLTVTAPVPEPRTYGMVLAGIVGLLIVARRKQKLA